MWTQTLGSQAISQDTQGKNELYRNQRYLQPHIHQQPHHQVVKVLEVKEGLVLSGARDN